MAHALADLAMRVLPERHRDWGLAMRAEVDDIEADGRALGFALGCAAAGLREGARHLLVATPPSHLAISFLTLAFAVFHLGCAWRGVAILGGAPEAYYLQLAAGDAAEIAAAAAYRQSTPMIVICLMSLGVAHLSAAVSLLVGGRRAFAWAWAGALISASGLALLVCAVTGFSAGLTILFAAIAIQALTVPFLWRRRLPPRPPEPIRFGNPDRRM